MARIPPEQMPQPIYPGATPQPPATPPAAVPPPGYPSAPAPHPGGPPAPGVPPGGGGKRPSTALIVGIAGAAVVIIGIVVVLVIVLGGEKKPTTGTGAGGVASAPSTSPSGGGDASQASQAAGILVGQASIPPVEHECVVDALDGDSALAGAVVGGTADSTAVADLVMSCVSSGTIADVVTKDLAGQYPASSVACLNTNIASLDQASLSSLLQAIYEGNVQAAQSIVNYAAAGC